MKITQTCLATGVAVVLLTGTAACTSGGDEPAVRAVRTTEAAACENGTYTWSRVDKRDVLTGVAEKQELGEGGGALTHEPAPLHTPRVAVTFEEGPRVDPEATLRALGARVGEEVGDDSAFADVRRPAPKLDTGSTSVDGAGTFVEYAWVRQVSADFRYTCGDGRRAAGRATSWIVDGSGVLECTEALGNAREGEPALAAARLSCDPDAPATGTGRT
ncbi:hypothetical protein [Streptomyces sp. NBC_00094]|uniref:hypothetical protein n=1 Tax=Streptomyces sp. NBC_00094 TaxID=2903620 RepID=UPI00224FECA2|nr:hypothetical protein [Streptomyces sp. NBC_00094]MCX5390078.1 hypothetical protein [Streptomyces sp. NBC_00094]